MADTAAIPVPTGPGASFSDVVAGVNTATFTLDPGLGVAVFQPNDFNNPGVATLYDSAGNTILTMAAAGYAMFAVPVGGKSYYFSATLGANLLAAVRPDNPARL